MRREYLEYHMWVALDGLSKVGYIVSDYALVYC
jgi:hypothetical protein